MISPESQCGVLCIPVRAEDLGHRRIRFDVGVSPAPAGGEIKDAGGEVGLEVARAIGVEPGAGSARCAKFRVGVGQVGVFECARSNAGGVLECAPRGLLVLLVVEDRVIALPLQLVRRGARRRDRITAQHLTVKREGGWGHVEDAAGGRQWRRRPRRRGKGGRTCGVHPVDWPAAIMPEDRKERQCLSHENSGHTWHRLSDPGGGGLATRKRP